MEQSKIINVRYISVKQRKSLMCQYLLSYYSSEIWSNSFIGFKLKLIMSNFWFLFYPIFKRLKWLFTFVFYHFVQISDQKEISGFWFHSTKNLRPWIYQNYIPLDVILSNSWVTSESINISLVNKLKKLEKMSWQKYINLAVDYLDSASSNPTHVV